MKPFIRTLPIFLLSLALLAACGKAEMKGEAHYNDLPAAHQTANSNTASDEMYSEAEETPTTQTDATKVTSMLIRTADIRMQVDDHAATMEQLQQMVAAHKGYIGGERSNGDKNYQETSLDIRVPNQHFDLLVNEIAGMAEKLDYKNISSQDVGEEYVDLEARLAARKTAEAAYLEILRSAKKVTDILEVQERLRQVREEIESAEGRMRYLRNQVDLSTITVTFYESHQVAAAAESGAGLGDRISLAFFNGWNAILGGIVVLTNLWPLWLLVIFLIVFRKRIFGRKRLTKAVNN